MAARSDEIEAPTAPFWMTTFSDMATILLVFFVMIVSMSSVEVKRFKEAVSYFQGRTGVLPGEGARIGAVPPALRDASPLAPADSAGQQARQRAEQARHYEELLTYIERQGLTDKVQVNLTEEGLHFVLHDAVMFRPGEADLVEPSRTLLALISTLLTPEVQQIVVEGHTDDRPIATARYPSNWELSTARAASVVRHFLRQPNALPADRYVPMGKGEFHPVEPNTTDAGRRHNRRVEIFFLWTSWQNRTPQTTR